jgi:glutamine synthetase
MAENPQTDYVLKTIDERGIHFIRLWFTDVLGNLKSFAVTPNEIETAFSEGMGFDGSAIEGFTRVEESDMLAFPDPETFQVLPWRPSSNGVARMFCNIRNADGTSFEGDPRYALKQMLRKAAAMGFTINVGPELEYFYFKAPDDPTPLDNGGYFDLTSQDSGTDLRRDTVLTLEKMGIVVEYSHHEAAPSQQEIDLRYTDALSMADNVMTYRLTVKEVALKHGVYATFMPKPIEGIAGSGMHVHQSLFTPEGDNAFFDPSDPLGYNLSKVAKHYIAGLLKYAPEFTAVTNQYVNSYKRLITGCEAPVYITWAHRDRSALVRVPMYKPDKEMACRVELRSPDPSCNPYLAFAVMLGAGLKGIEEELPLPLETSGTSAADAHLDLGQTEHARLPINLGAAIDLFEGSELMREVLGAHIFDYFVRNKREEWAEYCSYVTPWERSRYLETL